MPRRIAIIMRYSCSSSTKKCFSASPFLLCLSLFPIGSPIVKFLLKLDQKANSASAQYLIMASHYAVIKAVLIGVAAHHSSPLTAPQAIRIIQSCARTLEHCMPYPEKLRGLLAARSITDARDAAVLTGEF